MRCNGYCTSAEFTHAISESGLRGNGERKARLSYNAHFDNDDERRRTSNQETEEI